MEGITDSGELVISSPRINMTISDGTVVWKIWAEQAKVNDCYNFTNDCDICVASGVYAPIVNSNNSPEADFTGRMLVISKNQGEGYIQQIFFSTGSSNNIYSRMRRNGVWLPWKQRKAIVAKSFNVNGYIKYVSGLIIQWGYATLKSDTDYTLTYPIQFSANPSFIISPNLNTTMPTSTTCGSRNTSGSMKTSITLYTTATTTRVFWIAIGY